MKREGSKCCAVESKIDQGLVKVRAGKDQLDHNCGVEEWIELTRLPKLMNCLGSWNAIGLEKERKKREKGGELETPRSKPKGVGG